MSMSNEKELGFRIKILGTDEQLGDLSKIEAGIKGLALTRTSLNKAVKDGVISEKEYGQQIADVNLKTKNLQQSKRQLQRSIATENNLIQNQEGSYNQLSNQLVKLRQDYRNLGEAERLASGETLLKEITVLDNKLKQIDASMGNYHRNVGNYASGMSGLNMSFAQITREMPAFANSMQTGFMAISNNIPMLVDEINRLKVANVELAKTGKPTVSVLKSLAGAMFSWQTLLSVAVTLLTVYGKDLFDLAFGMSEAEKQQQKLNDAMTESESSAKEASHELRTLQSIVTDVTASQEDRKNALEALKKEVVELEDVELNHADAMQLIVDKTGPYIQAAEARAKADAVAKLAAEAEVDLNEKKNSSIQENIKWYDYLWASVKTFGNGQLAILELQKAGIENQSEAISEQEGVVERLNNLYKEYLATALEAEEGVGVNKKKRDAEKKLIEKYNKELIKLTSDLVHAEVDAMEYGIEQQRALLEQQKNDAIQALEEQLVEEKGLRGKLLLQAREINSKVNALIELEKANHLKELELLNLEFGKKEIADLNNVTDLKIQNLQNQAKLEELIVREKLSKNQITEKEASKRIGEIYEDAAQYQLNVVRGQQAELLRLRDDLNTQLIALLQEESTVENEQKRKSIEEQLDLIDEQNEKVKIKAQELATELAEQAKLNNEDNGSYLANILGVNEDEFNQIRQSFMQSVGSIYQAYLDAKRSQIDQALKQEEALYAKREEYALQTAQNTYSTNKKYLDKQLQSGVISQRQYNNKIEALERNLANEKDRISKNTEAAQERARKKAFEENKKLQKKQALIDGAAGVIKTLSSTPYPANLILAALHTAAVAIQLDTIDDQQYYERGGVIDGPSHKQGGVKATVRGKGNIELEGGEVIINKRSSKLFREELSAINSFRGYGVKFGTPNSAISSVAALGGMIPSPTPPPSFTSPVNLNGGMSMDVANYIVNGITEGINAKPVILTDRKLRNNEKDNQIIISAQTW